MAANNDEVKSTENKNIFDLFEVYSQIRGDVLAEIDKHFEQKDLTYLTTGDMVRYWVRSSSSSSQRSLAVIVLPKNYAKMARKLDLVSPIVFVEADPDYDILRHKPMVTPTEPSDLPDILRRLHEMYHIVSAATNSEDKPSSRRSKTHARYLDLKSRLENKLIEHAQLADELVNSSQEAVLTSSSFAKLVSLEEHQKKVAPLLSGTALKLQVTTCELSHLQRLLENLSGPSKALESLEQLSSNCEKRAERLTCVLNHLKIGSAFGFVVQPLTAAIQRQDEVMLTLFMDCFEETFSSQILSARHNEGEALARAILQDMDLEILSRMIQRLGLKSVIDAISWQFEFISNSMIHLRTSIENPATHVRLSKSNFFYTASSLQRFEFFIENNFFDNATFLYFISRSNTSAEMNGLLLSGLERNLRQGKELTDKQVIDLFESLSNLLKKKALMRGTKKEASQAISALASLIKQAEIFTRVRTGLEPFVALLLARNVGNIVLVHLTDELHEFCDRQANRLAQGLMQQMLTQDKYFKILNLPILTPIINGRATMDKELVKNFFGKVAKVLDHPQTVEIFSFFLSQVVKTILSLDHPVEAEEIEWLTFIKENGVCLSKKDQDYIDLLQNVKQKKCKALKAWLKENCPEEKEIFKYAAPSSSLFSHNSSLAKLKQKVSQPSVPKSSSSSKSCQLINSDSNPSSSFQF